MGTRAEHSRRMKGDVSTLLTSVLRTEPGLSPEQAVLRVQETLLSNNPYMPPKNGACIINSLPVELLAHIFRVGVEMQREGRADDEFEEIEDEQEKKGLKDELKRLRTAEEEDDDTSGEEDVDPATLPTDDNDPEWEDEETEEESGTEEEDDDDEDDEDDNMDSDEEDLEEEDPVPFEILVSHVCRQWRETAINTPDLWTNIYMDEPHQWDRYEAYLERAKGQTLDIAINIDGGADAPMTDCDHDRCANGLDVVRRVIGLILSKVDQWRSLTISTTYWLHAREFLKKFHDLPGAPALETFGMESYEDLGENMDHFEPAGFKEPFYLPFHGNAPNLQFVKLLSVHIDWDGAVSMFRGLQELDLRCHTTDVLPSWRAFSSYLKNSPQMLRLELHESGPRLPDGTVLLQPPATPATSLASAYYTAIPSLDEEEGGDPYEWPRYPLEVPSVRDLMLSDHEAQYALALLTKLHFPNLKTLSFDYEAGDFTEVIEACSHPLRGVTSRCSLFQTIEALELKCIGTVRSQAFNNMLEALSGLKHLSVHCYDVEEEEGFATQESAWIALRKNAKTVREAIKAIKATQSVPQTPVKLIPASFISNAAPGPFSFVAPNASLSIVPPSPSAPLPPTGAGVAEPAATPSTAQRDLSSLNVQLLLPNLEGMRIRGVPGRQLKRFLKRRIKIGAPLKTLSMYHEDDVSREDERWLHDHLDEFEYFSDSEEDSDDDLESLDGTEGDAEWEETSLDEDEGDDDDDDEDFGEDDDEDENGEDDDDDDLGGGEGEGDGRVQTRRGPSARATRRGAASMEVTTGLSNLD